LKNEIKNNEFYLDLAKEAAALSREILLQYFGRLSQVSEKEKAGLVSEADVESEKCIQSFLAKKAPEIDFMGEEGSFKSNTHKIDQSVATWVVDPLDGTTNYVHKFPIYCISIGLEINNELQVGVIDVPYFKDTYWAIRGGGAYKNGNKIHVSQRATLKNSLVATGFYSESDDLENEVKLFSKMLDSTRAVRRPGAAAYDLCMVAEGIFDVFWEKNLKPWDTAAGTLLVTEAGGNVTNYEGRAFHPNMSSILASSSKVYDEASAVIRSFYDL
jgi:myo-inositol-1(or 4)-monophosphatase